MRAKAKSSTKARNPSKRASSGKPGKSTSSRKPTTTSADETKPDVKLPEYSYKDYPESSPRIVYVRNVEEADDLIEKLKRGPLAFDMEWCVPMRRNAGERRTAELVEDPAIPKLGANILSVPSDDGKKLFRDYGILSKNMVELGVIAAAWDPSHTFKRKIVSLAKIFRRIQALAPKEVQDLEPRTGKNIDWYSPTTMKKGDTMVGQEMEIQWKRAHELWHGHGMSFDETLMSTVCQEMQIDNDTTLPGQGPSATFITYVIYALQADPNLPFEIEKLRILVQMEATSWERHRAWLIGVFLRRLEAQQAVPVVSEELAAPL
ncbi:hypothetical protein H0H92_007741 [Tricholoma furcatifolium]|nr:hypothetical protein H0H92_007741 [Tricholoma furcatifolium]